MAKNNCDFYDSKKFLAEKVGITLVRKLQGEIDTTNYVENVESYWEHQPFFYDKSGLFWFWNFDEHKYELWDEIDVMNSFDDIMDMDGKTVNSRLKVQYLESFKRVGRKKRPKEAPIKWIQFKDKAYSLESGNIYEVTPDYFFTNPIPFELGNTSETPVIDKLLQDWVGDKYVKDLKQIIAYCCYRSYPIQLLFCLSGSGRNGKTCFIRLLNKFIGKDNVCSTELDDLLNSRFEKAKLYKKLACTLGETNFGVLAKTSLLKKLVGGDLIGYEMKNKNPFDDYNYAKILISSNSLPSTDDTSDGFWRRWHIIKFPFEFSEGKDILLTIPEYEYNNLAQQIISILPGLLDIGKFENQGSIEQRKIKYIEASNPLSIFIKQFCEVKSDVWVTYSELYTAYVQYLLMYKRRKVKMKEFRSALEDEGFLIDRGSKRTEEFTDTGYNIIKNGLFIDGLRLKPGWKDIFVNLVNNMHEFPLGKYAHIEEVENHSLSSLSSQPVVEEDVK
jgi:P4 family phage/plasmid primase-like protien